MAAVKRLLLLASLALVVLLVWLARRAPPGPPAAPGPPGRGTFRTRWKRLADRSGGSGTSPVAELDLGLPADVVELEVEVADETALVVDPRGGPGERPTLVLLPAKN